MVRLVTVRGVDDDRLTPINDPVTQAPNAEAVVDALEFEMRRARERASSVLVIVVEGNIEDWVPDDVAETMHVEIARCLRRGVRTHDTTARLDTTRHVAVVAGAPAESAAAIVWRWFAPLVARRAEEMRPSGLTLRYAAFSFDGSSSSMRLSTSKDSHFVETAPALLARTFSAPLVELVDPARVARARVDHDRRGKEQDRARSRDVILALGGGAARAAAHIGALRALRENQHRVVGVAATSAGALVGAMALTGMSDEAILDRFIEFPRTTTYRHMRRLYAKYHHRSRIPRSTVTYFRQSGLAFMSSEEVAAIDDATFESFIEHFVGPDRDIATLPCPFSVTATDLIAGRSITLSSGPLHAALRATCALPGLFAPQALDERLMVDGATISDVPIKQALGLGARGRVMGVYLARPEQRVERFTRSAEIVTRANALAHTELVREQLRHAPELVVVPVQEIGWLDFRRTLELADVGFRAMQGHLETQLG
jgi:NTE family protein